MQDLKLLIINEHRLRKNHKPNKEEIIMNSKSISIFRKMTSILWIVLFLTVVPLAHATTHLIQFGGSFGLTYSPNSLNISVGDTIEWEGDFGMHPLSSTSVPTGAATFHQGSGSVFTYVVTVAGTYHYQCDVHATSGMTGSFTALATGVENIQSSLQPTAFRLEQNYPNPFNPTTILSFELPVQSFVSIKVYNVIGQEVATIVNENMAAGSYTKIWNASSMSSGVYFYKLEARQTNDGQVKTFTDTKKLVLLK
jgi:plastocyanin